MTTFASRDDWADAARGVPIEDEVARRGLSLRRSGAEMVGPCPVCGGTDRFGVHPQKGVFHCRGSGAGGDVIALVEYLDGCDFSTACEILTGSPPPAGGRGSGIDPERQKARAAARRAADEKRARETNAYRRRAQAAAHDKWQAGQPAAGTPVADYWHGARGLTVALPGEVLRFHPDLAYWWHPKRPDGAKADPPPVVIHSGPAMLAAIQDASGHFCGCHATWIDLSRPKGKAAIVAPDGQKQSSKKVFGSQKGGAIRLFSGSLRMLVGEGIETTAAAVDAEAACGRVFAGWAGVSLGNLGGKAKGTVTHPTATKTDKSGRVRKVKVESAVPDWSDDRFFRLPEEVTEAVYLMDGDSERLATANALLRACARNARPGRRLAIAFPGEGVDFADLLTGGAR